MKPNPFKYSVLTVGIVTAMGVASIATADSVSYDQTDVFSVSNKASASYMVEGNATEQKAVSNEVIVNVSETGAFSLIATVDDSAAGGTGAGDDLNENLDIYPQLGETVEFTHTLSNDGNVADSYTIDIANGASDDFQYDLDNTTIEYQKKNANGNVGGVQTILNGGVIELEAGESAEIVITAKAASKRVVGDNGVLTVTANSAYLTGKGQTITTAENINNAITNTPIYAITKSATTNLGTKNLDLNNNNAYVDYTITVKNEGTDDGTNVTIQDSLPNGLIAIQEGQPNYQAPTATGGVTPNISPDGKTVKALMPSIAQGDTVTLTFRAKAAESATAASDFVNYAVVRDDVNNDGTEDLIDSSGDNNDSSVTEENYEDPNRPDLGKDDNSEATVSPKNQTRNLEISVGTNKEVALISQNNIYKYTITNAGTDITEADLTDEVYFTVIPTTDNAAVTIETVFVDANNDGIAQPSEILPETSPNSGQYDLNAAVNAGLAPTESVEISVIVNTNGSGDKIAGSDLDTSEVMTVTVLPQGSVDDTPAPVVVNTTSTTTMRGIDLTKYQAIATCGTVPTTVPSGDWVTTEVTATAGSCVFYKLEATNTFTTTSGVNITDVVVADTLESSVTYQGDFTSATAADQSSAPLIEGRFGTLAPKQTGTILFSAKISQTGTNTTP